MGRARVLIGAMEYFRRRERGQRSPSPPPMVQRGRAGAPGMIRRMVERHPGTVTNSILGEEQEVEVFLLTPLSTQEEVSLLTPHHTQVGVLGLPPHPIQVEEIGQGLWPFHPRPPSHTWSYMGATI